MNRVLALAAALSICSATVFAEEIRGHIHSMNDREIMIMDDNGKTTKVALPEGSKLTQGFSKHENVAVVMKDGKATEIKKDASVVDEEEDMEEE